MTNEIAVQKESGDGKPMVSWAALLNEAVTKPGFIHEAYSRFHNYSLGNQLLALFQCFGRGIQPGPLATFPKWKELGRHVKKGEKALILCMPLACKRTKTVKADDGTEQDKEVAYTHFTYKAHWFVLAQTEGADYQPAALPEWNECTALASLNVQRIEFTMLDGNAQGYAQPRRKIAVSPVAALPHKTLFHELGHVILRHCEEKDFSESEITPRDVREVEAESVALLCCESLGLPGAEYSRGYIQEWGKGQAITERSAQRIFRAADQILRAGREADTPVRGVWALSRRPKRPLTLYPSIMTQSRQCPPEDLTVAQVAKELHVLQGALRHFEEQIGAKIRSLFCEVDVNEDSHRNQRMTGSEGRHQYANLRLSALRPQQGKLPLT